MRALILVDLQNDFLTGGALAVPDGDQIILSANAMQANFPLVVATQDWHPADHKSFASQWEGNDVGQVVSLNGHDQVMWPDHCVQGTRGAEFSEHLDLRRVYRIVQKGTDRENDSYSAFSDVGGVPTGLADALHDHGVNEVWILGLATDYCVKFTALDSVKAGFKTFLIKHCCRGVNLEDGDVEAAIEEMRSAGVVITDAPNKTTAKPPIIQGVGHGSSTYSTDREGWS